MKIKLTQIFVNSATCPPDKLRIEYCDTDLPGLYLLASSAGNTLTYFLRYRDNAGKSCHYKIGRASDISLADARKQAKTLRAEIALGADPSGEARARKAVLTFTEFFEGHYLPHAKGHKRSWRRDEELFRLRLRDAFGTKQLNRITRHEIMTFHSALPKQGLAPATCDHHLKLLKHAFNLAIDWEFLTDKNPAARVPMFNADNRVENLLTDDELQRLIKVLRTDANRPVCLIMLYLLSTGARLNEALSATWSQIDMQNRTWTIPALNSKSKRIRTIPLNDSAIDVLNQLDTSPEFAHLFINRRTKMPYRNISKAWNRIQGLANLSKRMRIHDARHTMAQLMCNAGRSLLEVQGVLGHAHYSTTLRYARLSMTTLQEAANTASKKIGISSVPTLPVAADIQPSVIEAAGKEAA